MDGSNLLHRALHVQQVRELDIGPAFSVLQTTRYLIDMVARPQVRVVVAWDSGRSSYRRGILPSYKDRPKMEDERLVIYQRQRAVLDKCLSNLGALSLRFKNVEADDIIARFAITHPGLVVIFSSDRDFLQLIQSGSTGVIVARPSRDSDNEIPPTIDYLNLDVRAKGIEWVDYTEFLREYGFPPLYFALFKSIVGDKSDHVPGVAGVGTKTASAFIYEWMSNPRLDYRSFPKRLQKGVIAITKNWDLIYRNLRLVDLYLAVGEMPKFEVPKPVRNVDFVHRLLLTRYKVKRLKENATRWFVPWRRLV